MTDRQREALQALADVMEKYDIATRSHYGEVWISTGGVNLIDIYGYDVDAEVLKEELRNDD